MCTYTGSTIYWFRKALRLHDNPALLESVCGKCCCFRSVFIVDSVMLDNPNFGINRWRFLLESLQNLDESLKQLGTRLYVLKGNPVEIFPRLFEQWKVTHLAYEYDIDPYAKTRDAEIIRIAQKHGITLNVKVSHTLYEPERIIGHNEGAVPNTYKKFMKVISKLGSPPTPVATFCKQHLKGCQLRKDLNHDSQYSIPTLEELGKDIRLLAPQVHLGGENEALKKMQLILQNPNWVCNFSKPHTCPTSLEPSTTALSPYIAVGCLSIRTLYYGIKEVYDKAKGNHTKPPVSLLGQLFRREFYYTAGAGISNFDAMESNPICIQIPWEKTPVYLDAWKNSKTGFPFIDAVMTQLRQEGWIHHAAREAVACFLTRGHMWVHWEEGKKVFEELLLDFDWAINSGNWLKSSAGAFFHKYDQVLCPVEFGKKTDPQGHYVRKYLPMLSNFPPEYIYQPWTAPFTVQEAANCIIGKDYPEPILNMNEARAINLRRIETVYGLHKSLINPDAEENSENEHEDGNGCPCPEDFKNNHPAFLHV